jgi:hypothetical protein
MLFLQSDQIVRVRAVVENGETGYSGISHDGTSSGTVRARLGRGGDDTRSSRFFSALDSLHVSIHRLNCQHDRQLYTKKQARAQGKMDNKEDSPAVFFSINTKHEMCNSWPNKEDACVPVRSLAITLPGHLGVQKHGCGVKIFAGEKRKALQRLCSGRIARLRPAGQAKSS